MTDELKKIIFSPQISNVFRELNWIINIDTKKNFYSYFIGEIADYYLEVDNAKFICSYYVCFFYSYISLFAL